MQSVDDMIDTVHVTVNNVPADAPKVAGYTTGTPDIQWTAGDWSRFKRSARVRINQHPAITDSGLDVIDLEARDWTLGLAIEECLRRKRRGIRTTIYLSLSRLIQTRLAVSAAGLVGFVRFWIADWDLSRDEAIAHLGGDIVAVQYASPSSNPNTMMPGSRLTLAQANGDLSVTVKHWHPVPRRRPIRLPRPPRPKPVHKKVKGSTAGAAIAGAIVALLHAVGIAHVTAAEASAAGTLGALLAGYLTPAGKH